VKGLDLGGGVEAAAVDVVSNTFEIFLFDETVIGFLVRMGTVKVMRWVSRQDKREQLINSDPLSMEGEV
jgi:hypothetical protein